MKLPDDHLDVHAEVVAVPEDFDHSAAERRRPSADGLREVGDLHVYNLSVKFAEAWGLVRLSRAAPFFRLAAELPVAPTGPRRLGRPFVPAGNDDFIRDAPIVRNDGSEPFAGAKLADHGLLSALEHAQDAPFEPAPFFRAHHGHFHAVAVERCPHA